MKKDCDSVAIQGQTWCAYCNHQVDNDGTIHRDSKHKSLHFHKPGEAIKLWYWSSPRKGSKPKKVHFYAKYGVCIIRQQDILADTPPKFQQSRFANGNGSPSPDRTPTPISSPQSDPDHEDKEHPLPPTNSPIAYTDDHTTPGEPLDKPATFNPARTASRS
jgi:hypothetical protein